MCRHCKNLMFICISIVAVVRKVATILPNFPSLLLSSTSNQAASKSCSWPLMNLQWFCLFAFVRKSWARTTNRQPKRRSQLWIHNTHTHPYLRDLWSAMWNMNSRTPLMIERRKVGRASINWPLGSNSDKSLSLCLSQTPTPKRWRCWCRSRSLDAMIMISKTNKRCCFCRCNRQHSTGNNYLPMHQLVRLSAWSWFFWVAVSLPILLSLPLSLLRLLFQVHSTITWADCLRFVCFFLSSLPLLQSQAQGEFFLTTSQLRKKTSNRRSVNDHWRELNSSLRLKSGQTLAHWLAIVLAWLGAMLGGSC